MAQKRHLTQYDSSGNKREIYLNDDEVFLEGGQTLRSRLAEMQEDIEDAAEQGGIQQETDPTVYSWAKQPVKPTYTPQEVGAVPSQGYVEYTQAEKEKLGALPTASELSTELGEKANTDDVYDKQTVDQKVANAGKVKSVSVNGGTPVQPVNGNVNLQGVATEDYVDDAVDDKLTQVVVHEITGAADIITIDDADLAFIDEDGNIAMRVAEGHVETQNFDSRQVATNTTAIQQLRSQIGGNVQTDVVVKEDSEAAFDIADADGNVVMRVGNDGHLKTKAFDSSAMNVFKQLKLDKPQCICHGYGASTGHQNTIPYYRAAVANGYEAFEVDAGRCSDGIPVCTHSYESYSVKRKSDGEIVSIQIAEITSAELIENYTWPEGDPIALLTDVVFYLCYLKRFPLFIHWQRMHKEQIKYIVDYAESIGVGEYVFHYNYTPSELPTNVKRVNLVIMPGTAQNLASEYARYKTHDNNLVVGFDPGDDATNKALCDAAHAIGCVTQTWTYYDVDRAREQFYKGADSVITGGIVNSQI